MRRLFASTHGKTLHRFGYFQMVPCSIVRDDVARLSVASDDAFMFCLGTGGFRVSNPRRSPILRGRTAGCVAFGAFETLETFPDDAEEPMVLFLFLCQDMVENFGLHATVVRVLAMREVPYAARATLLVRVAALASRAIPETASATAAVLWSSDPFLAAAATIALVRSRSRLGLLGGAFFSIAASPCSALNCAAACCFMYADRAAISLTSL